MAGLVAIAVLTPAHGLWAAQLMLVLLLLIIPGVILLRTMRVPGAAIAANCVYVPVASILVLTGSGLAIDVIGPLAGISAPLRATPLLVALEITCVLLLMGGRNAPPQTQIPWDMFERPVALAWPIVLPLAGAAGALRLNSGHGNLIAVIAIFLVVVTLVVTFLRAPWHEDAFLIVVIFAASLALMWSFSFRGDFVYGFDISGEYYSYTQTVTAGVWHFSHPNDAYGAMLSVTLLPAELHELSGVQTLLIFKAIDPVIGAFFPVGIFCLARRLLGGRWAFMAACLVIMQQTFFQEFPALTRQEIATVLFVVLFAAILDTRLSRGSRWTFVCLLGLGVVVSHYSTAYMAIPVLAITVMAQFTASWFKPVPRANGAVLLAFAASLAGAVVWYGALTHSASNVSTFVQLADGQGMDLLPNQSGGSLLSTYLQGEETPNLKPAQYQTYVKAYYEANYPYVSPLADASDPKYAVQPPSADPAPPVKLKSVANGLSLVNLLVQQLTNLLAGIGSLILVLRRKQRVIASQISFFGLAGMVILILTRLSGTIAQEYNPQRAFLQLLTVLGIIIAWFFQWLGGKYKWTRPLILGSCSAALGLYLIGTTGFSNALLGGATQSNLANNYTDYQWFVVNSQDFASAAWVTNETTPGQLIESDEHGQLRLQALAGSRPGMLADMSPETTDAHAWVYVTSTNLIDNVVDTNIGGRAGSYAFPKLFFDSNFNLVYTNGKSEVFHR
jgi:uncharacterized membrane protein